MTTGPSGPAFLHVLFNKSERVRDPIRGQRARQMIFNFGGDGGVFMGKFDTDARLPVALGTHRSDPHNASGNRQLLWLIHQSEQQNKLIP